MNPHNYVWELCPALMHASHTQKTQAGQLQLMPLGLVICPRPPSHLSHTVGDKSFPSNYWMDSKILAVTKASVIGIREVLLKPPALSNFHWPLIVPYCSCGFWSHSGTALYTHFRAWGSHTTPPSFWVRASFFSAYTVLDCKEHFENTRIFWMCGFNLWKYLS